ncbi:uncharacterized protein SCODWIG_00776 [Saccharomycodes ludwigii]|uniref:RING-Gid-type domain-containing protein n=1 Tax=Saccharomycodes ludwigii TaxID=36035 RepID=A0A376B2V6_9ASCO|nr:hypothetical protein SCDLUD_002748 [Saccharomycodes ludwigii]KAH3901259.1 hypothetical protein SCDLUD_002748 [Saccharomycodes ludwigii]SSD59015.1 uncharacterized protein SCODWIG_00776 [Saccharomycodes ludwigii]
MTNPNTENQNNVKTNKNKIARIDVDGLLKLNKDMLSPLIQETDTILQHLRSKLNKDQKLLATLINQVNQLLSQSGAINPDVLEHCKKINKLIIILENRLKKYTQDYKNTVSELRTILDFFRRLETAQKNANLPKMYQWIGDYTTYLCVENLIKKNIIDVDDPIIEELNVEPRFPLKHLLKTGVLREFQTISSKLINDHDPDPLLQYLKRENVNNDEPVVIECKNLKFIQYILQNKSKDAIEYYRTNISDYAENYLEETRISSSLFLYINSNRNLFDNFPISENDKQSIQLYRDLFHSDDVSMLDLSLQPNNTMISALTQVTPNNSIYNTDDSFKALIEASNDSKWIHLHQMFKKLYFNRSYLSSDDTFLKFVTIGISSMKTKSCTESYDITNELRKYIITNYNDTDDETNKKALEKYVLNNVLTVDCPTCSPEIRKIDTNLPYSLKTATELFDNPVVLPSGLVYDKQKLIALTKILNERGLVNTDDGALNNVVYDPLAEQTVLISQLKTIYPL